MSLLVHPVPRPTWAPLPTAGCRNVAGKVLLVLDHLSLALLRFEPDATIHEHAADIAIDVICLEGEGMVSVGNETATLQAGQRVHWPVGSLHCLWTTGHSMLTLMVEHSQTQLVILSESDNVSHTAA